jgi:DNA recombination protein RmuC
MQEALMVVLIVVVLALNGAVLWFLVRKPKSAGNGEGLKLVLQQINEINRTVDAKFGDLSRTVDSRINESGKTMNESVRSQLAESSRLIKDVTAGLTKLDETNKQVISFADQLQSLQDILKNPKQRGILGEYYLETLLKNVLAPGMYQMQYKLGRDEKTGQDTIVDAAVFVKDKIIPIDSKFSLENYNRLVEAKDVSERDRLKKAFVNDLKMRIQETSKYIQPSRGTMDFAFMFIPHEAIYYDLLVNTSGLVTDDTENLIQRAASKYHVLIVSPTSFLAYLQTVLQGLKALHIEEEAAQIRKNVEDLGRHLDAYGEYHSKLGSTLSTAINHYNKSSSEFKKIDKDMIRIGNESLELDMPVVDKPQIDD